MSDRPCRRFRVTGRVQGVWFRASTRREAERLGLSGRAVNLADGSVEVVAAGPQAALDALAAWLRRGPPMARVESVDAEDHPDPGMQGFETG
ncbi:acylphosphatase [Elongatibacter sediminis]|uniref:acylphosphatase n=1 Tax=Elongatibacter sediminis TaxID=3119006 RepID=A0AAW9RJ10_9GAMM